MKNFTNGRTIVRLNTLLLPRLASRATPFHLFRHPAACRSLPPSPQRGEGILWSYGLTLFLFLSLAGCKKEEDKNGGGGGGGNDIPVTGVTIKQPSNTTLEVGKTLKLTATVQPSNATNKKIIWESEDENIATVSASGVVTAVGEGDTYIYASSDADYENCYDYIEISVTDNGGGGGGGGGGIDPNLFGWWYTGSISGGLYDPITGHYLGASGAGTMSTYQEDGKWFCLLISKGTFTNIYVEFRADYSAKNGIIKKTNYFALDSNDGGKTFDAPRKLDDDQFYYVIDNKGNLVTSNSYPNPLDDPNKTTYRRP